MQPSDGGEAAGRKKRLDSSLEAKGAEYLTLGHLLTEGIVSYLAYERNAGHDILACNPFSGKSCRIEVKSRYYTDGSKTVHFKSFDFDFAALVMLNRKSKRVPSLPSGLIETYIVPVAVVKEANRGQGQFGIRFRLSDLDDMEPSGKVGIWSGATLVYPIDISQLRAHF